MLFSVHASTVFNSSSTFVVLNLFTSMCQLNDCFEWVRVSHSSSVSCLPIFSLRFYLSIVCRHGCFTAAVMADPGLDAGACVINHGGDIDANARFLRRRLSQ